MKKTLTALVLAPTTLAGPAHADDIDTVRALYTEILTDPSATTSERY